MIQDFNLHTHTARCGHAVGTDDEYVQAALKAGYKFLGFADHAPYKGISRSRARMDWEQLDEYLVSMQRIKEKYAGQIEIKIGFETEFYPEWLEERKKLLARVDYLLLGQHFETPYINDGAEYFDHNSDEEIIHYGETVCKGMETGIFTYVCHPDVFLNGQSEFTEACAKVAHMIAAKAVETDMPLEVNIRGVQKGYKHFDRGLRYYYPHRDFWEIVAQYPVKCLYGIDAHDPADIMDLASVQDAYDELKDLGLNFIDNPLVRK